MGGGRRRLTKADLEAMLEEFEIAERYGEPASIVNRDLLQIRRSAMFGEPLEEWARACGVPLAFARALRAVEEDIEALRDSLLHPRGT